MKVFSHILFACITIITLPFHNIAQTTILSEDFDSGTHSSWSNTQESGTSGKWEFDNPEGRSTPSLFSGSFAILDSDGHGNGANQKAKLTTPSFDASAYTTVTLEYDYQYRKWNGPEFCKVQIYDGSSWTDLITYEMADANYSGSDHVSIDITTETGGNSNAKVRFYYKGSYDYWFALDNIEITGTSPSGGGGSGGGTPLVTNGPGGIGSQDGTSGLKLWLDASNVSATNGSTVTNWTDASGNNNNFNSGNGATYNSSGTNGYPTFSFNGYSNYFEKAFSTDLSPDELTIFSTNKVTADSDYKCIISNRDDPSGSSLTGYMLYASPSEDWQFWTGTASSSWHTSPVRNSTASNWAGIMLQYDASTNSKLLNSSASSSSATASSPINKNTIRPIRVGAGRNETTPSYHYKGQMGEVILFDEVLTDVEVIIVQNYLAAKYNYTLASNDLYSNDQSGSGNYDHKVAGIGKASDGSSHSDSKGTGIVQINSPLSLNNGDYLFWGENQINSDYSFSTASDYKERANTQWRVNHIQDIGTVSLSVNASDLDLSDKPSCAPVNLIVSVSSNFSSKTTYPLTLTDGVYSTNGVTLPNGYYFTFEYQDLIVIENSGFTGGSGASSAPSTNDGCYKLLVKSSANGTYKIAIDASVREVEIEAGGEFSIESGISLTVNNNIVNNGSITVKESGSLIQNSTGVNTNSGSGDYTVIRNGNTNSYIYNIWSSPISSASLNTVFSDANKCDVWTFEKHTQAWKYDYLIGTTTSCYGNSVTFGLSDIILGGDGIMDVTRGYFIPGNLFAARTYNGQVNNGDYSTAIVTTTLINPGGLDWGDDDWNLLGNPYPSGLDAAAFWQENAIDNNRITDALYFWDEADTAGGYNQTSDYASWSAGGAVESGNSNELPLGAVASGQGFWVVANTSTDVVFKNSMRVSSNSQFFKSSQAPINHNAWFRFESPSNYKNNILVGYNANSTDSIDQGYDAHKLVGNGHVRFASVYDNEEFVIQSLAPFITNETKKIPLVVFTDESGAHTFSEYRRENLSADFKIYLKDKTLNITHDLSKGAYSVSLIANTTYDTRFELVFINQAPKSTGNVAVKDGAKPKLDTANTITNVEDEIKNDFILIQSEAGITLSNKNGINGSITVLDVTGKVVWHQANINNQNTINISLDNVTNGIYFIEVLNQNQRVFSNKILKQ